MLVSFTTMVAPDTTPPPASSTTPEIDAEDCALARDPINTTSASAVRTTNNVSILVFIAFPPFENFDLNEAEQSNDQSQG